MNQLVPLPRHPNGNLDWSDPAIAPRIRTMLRRGRSLGYIAQRLGISRAALADGYYSQGLDQVPSDLVPVADLVEALGFRDFPALRRHLALRGIQVHPWGARTPCLKRRQLDTLLADQQADPILTVRPAGTVTVRELVRRWQLPLSSVQGRVKGLPYRRYRKSTAGGIAHLFDERDVERVAPPVAPRGIPRGYLGAPELAELTGRTREAVRRWARLGGCPHIRNREGDLCFRLEDVIGWMLAHRDCRLRRTGRWLSAQQQQGRAA